MRYKFLLTALCSALIGTVANAQTHKLAWARVMGSNSSSQEVAYATKTDDSGNVYTTGKFFATATFDTGIGTAASTLTSFGGGDIFVTKHDKDGNIQWVKKYGGSGDDFAYAMVLDKDVNIYLTGYYKNSADFDQDPNTPQNVALGAEDIFVMKLDRNGNFVWVKTIGFSGTDQGSAIALDPWGNILVTGQYTNTVDFDPNPSPTAIFNLLPSASGNKDVFVLKLANNGDFIWAKRLGTKAVSKGIGVDQWGYVYSSGNFNTTGDFDPDTAAARVYNIKPSSYDVYVSKLDSGGKFVWAKKMGGTSSDQTLGMCVDKNGIIHNTGYFGGTADFNPDTAAAAVYPLTATATAGFVSKLDSGGNFKWAAMIDANYMVQGYAVTTDDSGNVYSTGGFKDTTDFDPDPVATHIIYTYGPSPFGNEDAYVLKLDSAGKFRSVERFGGISVDIGQGINVDKRGYIYTCGYFSDTVDFDPNDTVQYRLGSHGKVDMFLTKLGECKILADALTIPSCGSYTFNGQQLDTTGTYVWHFPLVGGCDSIVTLNLTVNHIIPALITVNGFTLGTPTSYKTYQWYMNGSPIQGATNSTYDVAANGEYKLVVTDSAGCTDTSDVKTITNVGVQNVNAAAYHVTVYPNPAVNVINIQAPVAVNAVITGMDGKVVKQENNAHVIDIKNVASGVYIIRITDENGTLLKIEKLVKANQ